MSYRYERYERYNVRPRSGRTCLIALVVVVWVILLAGLAIRYIAVPAVANSIRERFASSERVQAPQPEGEAPAPAVPDGVAVLPENVPAGTFAIGEEDANAWIQANQGELRGIDAVRLRFVPGEVQAAVTVAGITSTARAGAQVVDGRIQVTNARLDPPLSYIVDVTPFAQLIEERLNRDLASTGRSVSGVTIDQGWVTLSVE